MFGAISSSGRFQNVEAFQLKKLILKLRWIGRGEDADRLLRELAEPPTSKPFTDARFHD